MRNTEGEIEVVGNDQQGKTVSGKVGYGVSNRAASAQVEPGERFIQNDQWEASTDGDAGNRQEPFLTG